MSGMGVTHMDHCSVIVTDVAKSRSFYRDVLGLPEIAPPKTFDFVTVWFDLGGGQTLHLLRKPHPDTIGPRHFALHVSDAKAARIHVRSYGVAIDETVEIPHCDRFFIRDPDGNRIELIQWLEPYDSQRDGRFSA
jgi:catechol 2,3-dioxygenase-like lactoylglutathione lyase family enzyme